jgi:hypothetical protein
MPMITVAHSFPLTHSSAEGARQFVGCPSFLILLSFLATLINPWSHTSLPSIVLLLTLQVMLHSR